jgi:hypothetical protein
VVAAALRRPPRKGPVGCTVPDGMVPAPETTSFPRRLVKGASVRLRLTRLFLFVLGLGAAKVHRGRQDKAWVPPQYQHRSLGAT